jgi:hypothetical protein
MSTPTPPSLVEAFCADGVAGVDYDTILVPPQTGVSPEIASFSTGFPPATRTPRTQGGIPPRGTDMNGILRMATAHTAWVAAGGQYVFNADVVSVAGGYPVGAVLQSAVNPLLYFQNTVNGNTNDPDSVLTGWVPFSLAGTPTSVQTPSTLAAGSQSIVTTSSIGFLELTGDAGGTSSILNITGGANGQILVVSNAGAPFVTLLSSGNLRLPVDLTLLQNDGQAFRFSSALNKWVKM